MKKILFNVVLLLVLSSTSQAANAYKEFYAAVTEQCSDVNSLLVKKSYLSLLRKKSCKSVFLQNFLKECEALTCEKVKVIYALSNSGELGNVIGR